MKSLRLDKLVCDIFKITRKQAKKEISCGCISVNGILVKDSAAHCGIRDEIARSGLVGIYQQFVYIMMNKPKGVLSATSDGRATTAIDILSPELRQRDLFVAGRLDKDTTGFLLLTNDGDFAHNILSPKKHIPKTYDVVLQEDISNEDIEAFLVGIQLNDFTCKPAILVRTGDKKAQITITEGKFHQIKRMFQSRGNEVLELHRSQMGGLHLDESLLPGEARYISDAELKQLKGDQ